MTTSLTWRFTISADDKGAIPAHVDEVMSQMLDREDAIVHDTSIGLDLEAMTVEISVIVEGLALDTAVSHGTDIVRSAMAAVKLEAPGSTHFTHAELIAV